MITQYSHQQVTLTDREKEYAWFNYAAEIIKAGCRDQSMSGYQVTGTGSDGKPVTVELTKEELFQIFAEVTTKLGILKRASARTGRSNSTVGTVPAGYGS